MTRRNATRHRGETVEHDWALFDVGSGLTTCLREFSTRTELLPPKTLPLRESAMGGEVKSTGARIVSAENDGVPLTIEFQVTNVKWAIVRADTFAENGHVPILPRDPCVLLCDGRGIKPCRAEGLSG